jgi:hypothetical protein
MYLGSLDNCQNSITQEIFLVYQKSRTKGSIYPKANLNVANPYLISAMSVKETWSLGIPNLSVPKT